VSGRGVGLAPEPYLPSRFLRSDIVSRKREQNRSD
jgi:hypothetical protein